MYLTLTLTQVTGALERTQELIAVYKADNVRGKITAIEEERGAHAAKVPLPPSPLTAPHILGGTGLS
jgi:hypothetical protein